MTISKNLVFLHALDPTDPASKHMTLAFSRSFCNSSATSVAWETTSFPPRPEPVGSPYKKRPQKCGTRVILPLKTWSYGPLLTNRFFGPTLQNLQAESIAGVFLEKERMKGTLWGFHHGFGFRSMLIKFQVFYDGGGRKDLFDLDYFS